MKIRSAITGCIVAFFLFTGCQSPSIPPQSAQGVEFVMDTFLQQLWYGDDADAAYQEIADACRALEKTLSLYDAESEVAAINAAAGEQPVAVSAVTYRILSGAVAEGIASHGAFDITIAPLSLLWEVTAEHPVIPPPDAIATARASVDYRKLQLDPVNQTAFLAEKGMQLDLGGIAKGFAAGELRQIAQKHKVQGFLSLGGNMMVEGKKPDGSDYRIGVRDPRGTETDYLGTLALDGYTMATTGDYERYFEADGVRYHHVIDPATGAPAQSGLIAVTVVSTDGLLADALSTSIFLQGKAHLPAALARTDCMVLAVTEEREVFASDGFWERFTLNPAAAPYRFRQN